MKSFKRILAAVIAGCTMLSFFGCKDEEKAQKHNLTNDGADNVGNVKEDDMPYGATITQIKKDSGKVNVGIDYDNRYMTEDEAIKVSNYVEAFGTANAELMESTVYEGYLDKYVEKAGFETLEEYLTTMRDKVKNNYILGEFEFNYVVINDCIDGDDPVYSEQFASMDANLKSIYGDLNITDKKLVFAEFLYSYLDKDGSFSFSNDQGSDSMLFIYTIDGKPYIVL